MTSPSPWWTPDPRIPAGAVVRRGRTRLGVGLLLTAIISIFAVAAFAVPTDSPRRYSSGMVEYPPTLAALVSSCSGIIEWPPPDPAAVGWLPIGSYHRYPMSPPVSGTYSQTPPTLGFHSTSSATTPGVEQAINLLWHGGTVIWYDPQVDRRTLDTVEVIAEAHDSGNGLLVAPWPQTLTSQWPGQRPVIITGWSAAQACSQMTFQVLDEFEAYQAGHPAPGSGTPLSDPGPRAQRSGTGRPAT